MNENKGPSSIVVGLALFSMFFGSGNLIFPLHLGALYQDHFWICALGFILTAVLLPSLGILSMIPAAGNYEQLLSPKYKKIGSWFFFLVLIFWIPLGSGPRCVLLAHASLQTTTNLTPPLWLFSILFLVLCFLFVKTKNRLIEILGVYLTPILLISIALIVISSLSGASFSLSNEKPKQIFFSSLLEGYYTQDLIAAIFFSSAIVEMLRGASLSKKAALRKTLKGGLISAFLLALLYTALMASSAVYGDHLTGLSGEKMVSTLAHASLGATLGGISSVVVSLACFTTEIALVLVFTSFLQKHFVFSFSEDIALFLTLGAIFLLTLLNFEGVMAIVSPAMQIIYPVLFFLVARFLIKKRRKLGNEFENL